MFKTDYVEPKLRFEFLEDDSEVDGKHVLAKVKGTFFCPEGVSRNKRYYTRSLWEKALSDGDVQRKLRTKTMFGTIGHDTELTDKTLQEGKISHIVTKAYIDEQGQGIGEALILNTPSGSILNTVLRAGSEVFVSSRADGQFKGTKNGIPLVDENTYNLKGWDFVLSPGFLQANPKIAEEYENTFKGETQMDAAMADKVKEENMALREKLIRKDYEVKSQIDEALKPVEEENAHVKKELHEAASRISELEESLKATNEEKSKLEESLEAYSTLGESFENIKEAMEVSHAFMNTIHEEFGTVEEIREAMTRAVELKEAYDAIGTIDETKAALDIALALIGEKKEAEDDMKAKELADKLDVKAEAVKKMMKKGMSEEEIEDIMKSAKKDEVPADEKKKKMKESDMEDEPKMSDKEKEEMMKKKKKMESAKDENLGEAAIETPKKSRAARLMEELSR